MEVGITSMSVCPLLKPGTRKGGKRISINVVLCGHACAHVCVHVCACVRACFFKAMLAPIIVLDAMGACRKLKQAGGRKLMNSCRRRKGIQLQTRGMIFSIKPKLFDHYYDTS